MTCRASWHPQQLDRAIACIELLAAIVHTASGVYFQWLRLTFAQQLTMDRTSIRDERKARFSPHRVDRLQCSGKAPELPRRFSSKMYKKKFIDFEKLTKLDHLRFAYALLESPILKIKILEFIQLIEIWCAEGHRKLVIVVLLWWVEAVLHTDWHCNTITRSNRNSPNAFWRFLRISCCFYFLFPSISCIIHINNNSVPNDIVIESIDDFTIK